MSAQEENKELIRSWIAITDAQEFDSYIEFLSSDFVAHFPEGDAVGQTEVEQAEKSFALAFSGRPADNRGSNR